MIEYMMREEDGLTQRYGRQRIHDDWETFIYHREHFDFQGLFVCLFRGQYP